MTSFPRDPLHNSALTSLAAMVMTGEEGTEGGGEKPSNMEDGQQEDECSGEEEDREICGDEGLCTWPVSSVAATNLATDGETSPVNRSRKAGGKLGRIKRRDRGSILKSKAATVGSASLRRKEKVKGLDDTCTLIDDNLLNMQLTFSFNMMK